MPTNKELEQQVKDLGNTVQSLVDVLKQTDAGTSISGAVKPLPEAPVVEGEQTTTTHSEPELKSFCSPEYKKAALQILGKDFEFDIEEVGDQDMYYVTVPEKYWAVGRKDNYISHWKSRRTLYENDITRRNPNISMVEKTKLMDDYDIINTDPVIPQDQRHRAASAIRTVVDIRKWLMFVRANIKKERETAKEVSEIPTESLQEELK